MMRWLALLGLLFQLAAHAVPALTNQSGPVITDMGAEVKFAEKLVFHLNVQPLADVNELMVVISGEGQQPVLHKISLEGASDQTEIVEEVSVDSLSLLPFTEVTYHFEASLKSGGQMSSEKVTFEYNDDRFEWKEYQSGIFDVYWYDGDAALGRQIANIAQLGLERSQSVLLVKPPEPLRIYAYSKSADLQSALGATTQEWVAGHATPQVGMVLISVPSGPERKLELERQIPHEIMHILQYQVIKNGVEQQPVWLIEGMASLAELYPNPEYSQVLESAAAKQQLISFESLCVSLPRETAGAFQAYAQSDSFVRYLQRKYGASGLRALMDAYQNGMGCSEGVEAALGEPLSQVEKQWQQEVLGINQTDLVMGNLSPYLMLGLLLIVPAAAALFPIRTDDEEEEED
jgi:hypothetical protein